MRPSSELQGVVTDLQRSDTAPVARGDRVDGKVVIGFAYSREPLSTGDVLLLAGDEGLDQPPARPVPARGDSTTTVERCGPAPLAELDPARIRVAPPHLRTSFERLLIGLREGGVFVWALLEAMAAREYDLWLAGGSVRDLLADGPAAAANDLDFSGTAGPGEFTDTATRLLRRAGAGDYVWRISDGLVWSLSPEISSRDRIMEYRPLALGGFPFPAYGGSLVEDTEHRDLTVNALYYDHRRDLVLDPSGVGLEHLHAIPRVMVVPYRGTDPLGCAAIILRCLKFRIRWRHVELAQVRAWVGGLPGTLAAEVPKDSWGMLTWLRKRCVPAEIRGAEELSLAEELGPAAVGLVKALQKGAH
jgi:hypothetical protein